MSKGISRKNEAKLKDYLKKVKGESKVKTDFKKKDDRHIQNNITNR